MAGVMALLFPGGAYFYARFFYPGIVFFTLEALLLTTIIAVGTSVIPSRVEQPLLLGGLVLTWVGIKAAGWIHAGHFFKRYIPRKSRLGRWSPSPAGEKAFS
jgi:hypothetical protein